MNCKKKKGRMMQKAVGKTDIQWVLLAGQSLSEILGYPYAILTAPGPETGQSSISHIISLSSESARNAD